MDRGDQQLHQRVGDFHLPLHQQSGQHTYRTSGAASRKWLGDNTAARTRQPVATFGATSVSRPTGNPTNRIASSLPISVSMVFKLDRPGSVFTQASTSRASISPSVPRAPGSSGTPNTSPVTLLHNWVDLAGMDAGPLFRPVSKGNRALTRRLSPGAVNDIIQNAVRRADIDVPEQADKQGGYSAHSLRAGFVTYAHTRGASDRAIAHQTRHR